MFTTPADLLAQGLKVFTRAKAKLEAAEKAADTAKLEISLEISNLHDKALSLTSVAMQARKALTQIDKVLGD